MKGIISQTIIYGSTDLLEMQILRNKVYRKSNIYRKHKGIDMNDTLVMDIQELDPEKWHMSSKQRMEKSTKYDNANLKHIGNY